MVISPSHKNFILLAIRWLLWIVGGVLIIWVILSPAFRNNEGDIIGVICLPIAAGFALGVLGGTITTPLKKAGLWFALALFGQANALQMINAGPLLHYQHYRPLSQLIVGSNPIFLVILGLQTLAVGFALWRRRRLIFSWIKGSFKTWQLVLIGMALFLCSATVSSQYSGYLAELVFAAFVEVVNLGNIVLAVWELPDESVTALRKRFDKFFGTDNTSNSRSFIPWDRFIAAAIFWVIIASAFLNQVSYQQHPHIADEVAYLYHARYLAESKLATPAPRTQSAFDLYLMQFDGARWFPVTPPGWPAMLAVGVLLGAPWLVNPVLGGINILLIYWLLYRIYSLRVARLAIFLLCLSPWYIFMAMNFLTHTFTLTCALVGALGILFCRDTGRSRWAWLAGAAVGVMSLVRPLEGLIMAVLLGLWAIGLGGQRLRHFSICALVFGTAIFGGIVLPYNKALEGKPTAFPLNVYTDQRFGKNSNAYGFGPDRGMGWGIDPNPGHSPTDGMINANLNITAINIELFGWSTGSLLFIALFLFSGRYQRSDYLMAFVCLAIFIAFFFYYFSGGPDFGARYWFLMIVPLAALTVRGIEVLENKLSSGPFGTNLLSSRALIGVLALSILALVNFIPWRAIDKYHHYLLMNPDIQQLAKANHFGKSLVLVRGDQLPDYASAAVFNPVDMNSDAPLYAWDRSPEASLQALEAYSDRPVWIVAGPTVTKMGFELLGGPFNAQDLISGQVPIPK